jgi:hypothetical protein
MEFLNALLVSLGYFIASSNTFLAALFSPLLLEQTLRQVFAYLFLGELIAPLDLVTLLFWILGSLFR